MRKQKRVCILEYRRSERIQTLRKRQRRDKAAIRFTIDCAKKERHILSKLKKTRLKRRGFKKSAPRRKLLNKSDHPRLRTILKSENRVFQRLFSGGCSSGLYIMSDVENSDSDMSGDDSDHPGDKVIPRWAQRSVIPKLVKLNRDIDPDSIFGSYINQTINLRQLYKGQRSKKRYVKRNPSGNWSLDRLTEQERDNYKLDMGWHS